jgi:hypothetical protein
VRLNNEHLVPLTTSDLMTLRAGLTAYLREFARHRAEDGGATHPEEEWEAMKREVGQLLWRLEEAALPPGSDIEHSDEAVRPEGR